MEFEVALAQEISGLAGMTYKVSPLTAPDKRNPPYIAYMASAGLQDKDLNGYQGTYTVSGELNIIHTRYLDMMSLTRAVIAKLVTFQGRVIGTGGPYIQNITYNDPIEMYEKEVSAYRCNISFTAHI
jgi:hypothetical protein